MAVTESHPPTRPERQIDGKKQAAMDYLARQSNNQATAGMLQSRRVGPSPARSIPSIAIAAIRPGSRQDSVDRRAAKKVRFYRNGDHFFAGLTVSIQCDSYRSLASLMKVCFAFYTCSRVAS